LEPGWDGTAREHYVLAQSDTAAALRNRPDKPANLIPVAYQSHSNLPALLRAVTPEERCAPFVKLDESFSLFREAGSDPAIIPFPSRQEYLDGEVPALAADAEVSRRPREHGWTFVLDLASVGKTTLSIRIATAPERRRVGGYRTRTFSSPPEEVLVAAILTCS